MELLAWKRRWQGRHRQRAEAEGHEAIAVELAERKLSEITRHEKCDQIDLGAEPEAEQRYADRRQHAVGVGEESKPGDRREEQDGCDIGREEAIDEITGQKASTQRRQAEDAHR